MPARKRCIVAVICPPVEARDPDREAEEAELELGGQHVAAEPAPRRPREAHVRHRPVPAVAAEVGPRSRASAPRRARRPAAPRARRSAIARASSAATSTSPRRPAMFATSSRQPSRSNGGREPALDDGLGAPEQPLAERVGAVVELRQRAHAGPRLVAVRSRSSNQKKPRSGASASPCGAREPAVVVADVVDREVADHADPARVRGANERDERLVAAEQRVDLVEGRRVVAVVGARREERRQVEDRDAEPLEVVQMRLDRRRGRRRTTRAACRAPSRSGLVPAAGHRPLGRRSRDARAREAVGEDLVDDALDVPGRAVVSDRGDEVVGVGDVVADEPVAGHPAVADHAAREQPAIGRRRVVDRGRRRATRSRRSVSSSTSATATCGSPSVHVAHGNRVDGRRTRHAEPHRRRRPRAPTAPRGRRARTRRGAARRAERERWSSLHRALGEPADDPALEDDEDAARRAGRRARRRRRTAPIPARTGRR